MEIRKDEEEEEEIEESIEEEKEEKGESIEKIQETSTKINIKKEEEGQLLEENINIENNINKEQDIDSELTSTYILKYTRKGEQLKEISAETGLRKSENCLFMLNIKLIKSDSVSLPENETQEISESFLVFCCHEIAAIYFDEIYERVYTLDDLSKENKYFKVFESTEEAKNVIDETIKKNEKNDKKIFLAFKDKELKLHMKLSFFDKEKEIVLNIPKKILNDDDKVNLLPEFLKEIQDKINHLNDENKKLKAKKNKAYNNRINELKYNYRANKTFDLYKNDLNEKNQLNDDINNNTTNKKIKKKVKIVKKKNTNNNPEENYFNK